MYGRWRIHPMILVRIQICTVNDFNKMKCVDIFHYTNESVHTKISLVSKIFALHRTNREGCC